MKNDLSVFEDNMFKIFLIVCIIILMVIYFFVKGIESLIERLNSIGRKLKGFWPFKNKKINQ